MRLRRPPILDLATALVIGVAITVEIDSARATRGPWWANAALCVLLALPLAWWRRAPLAAAVGTFTGGALQSAFLTPLPPHVTPIALALLPPFAVACASRLPLALWGGALCLVGEALIEIVTPAGQRDASGIAPTAGLSILAWCTGRIVRDRRVRARQLEEIEVELRATRSAREAHVVAEEREQVARELHDVIAHAMTVICLQAGAARRTWECDPEHGSATLAAIGDIARKTLAQLRAGLALTDPEASYTHLELEELEALAAGARGTGLDVIVNVVGPPRALPSRVGLVAYRIVQEALTNAARHAAPTAVRVEVTYGIRTLDIEVTDSGRQPGASPAVSVAGSGSGLQGMRERVEACAGRLVYGTRPAGGFAIVAHLPCDVRS